MISTLVNLPLYDNLKENGMKIIRSSTLVIFITALAFGQFNDTPQVVSKVATTAGNWLKLGADVRAMAMGGAGVASGRGVSAIPSNPAAIAYLNNSQVYFSKVNYFAGISQLVFAGGAKLGRSDFLAFNLFFLGSGDIERTTEDQPNGTGSFYNTASLSLRTSYAKRLTDRLKVGISLNYINDRLDDVRMNTFTFDIGSNFSTGIYGFVLGMAISNFGPEITYYGSGLDTDVSLVEDASGQLKKVTRSFPLPLSFRLGVANELIGPNSIFIKDPTHRVSMTFEGINPLDYLVSGNMGMEYSWREIAFIRAGSFISHDTGRLSAGAGYRYRADMFIIAVDYAFVNYGILESTQHFSIGIDF